MTGIAAHSVARVAATVSADAQAKNPNGALGLLVFLLLAVAVFFLLRSMTKHLRKVQKIDFNEPPGSAPKEPTPRIPPGA
jgi:hypothetical protein